MKNRPYGIFTSLLPLLFGRKWGLTPTNVHLTAPRISTCDEMHEHPSNMWI
jgi:hypothetical protein